MKLRMFLLFFTRSISERKGRIAIASISVTLAVTVIIGMIAVSIGVGDKLGNELKTYGANIIVSPLDKGYIDYDDLKRIKEIDNVLEAEAQILERVGIKDSMIEMIGLDFSIFSKKGWRLSGALPKGKYELLAGTDLENVLGLDVNKKLSLKHEDKIVEFIVSGFIETGGAEDKAVIISIHDAREITGSDDRASIVLVNGKPGELDNVVEKIKSTVAGASVKTLRQVAKAEESLLNKIQLLMSLVTLVVLFAAIISVASTMGANVLERREEIGLMMAIGATHNMISLFYVAEALLIGIIGGIAGFVLGYASAQVISQGAFGSFIDVPLYLFIVSLTGGIFIPLIASHFPVRNAMKLSPALILRGE